MFRGYSYGLALFSIIGAVSAALDVNLDDPRESTHPFPPCPPPTSAHHYLMALMNPVTDISCLRIHKRQCRLDSVRSHEHLL